MAFQGKIIVFVEGSRQFFGDQQTDPLDTIWRTHMTSLCKLLRIERIVPISKKNITVMAPGLSISGVGAIPLDLMINREIQTQAFDVAVVIWDLLPPWNRESRTCRWNETVDLFRRLAERELIREPWLGYAKNRYAELVARKTPGVRKRLPLLQSGSVLAVCMEPAFESLLLSCEQEIRETLGARGRHIPDWPNWNLNHPVPKEILQNAIVAVKRAARGSSRSPGVFRLIRGTMENEPNAWGELFLRRLLALPKCRARLRAHHISRRLRELLHQDR